ncbi:hypothetical protein GCM10007304_28290 [Rhodococcoides trifolii]|uniref:TobH protein n=1 Tax=Rhodococcoides trifolii TaxID=908250 RepID=A0A917D8A5_9NOCA|nr:tobH protein [Rhodococcus trifolii]GGG12635.1 hypothetical protein GCM10007304_28290 [Rhodococcus trifolii]
MTAPSSVIDIDDSVAVLAADSHGSLHSAALAGAQVRATAAAVAEGLLDHLVDLRPRSVVLVASSGRARRAASLAAAALGGAAGLPLVHVSATPPWVGPLDVVVVAGDDAGDPRTVDSVAAAVRRRAEVVVAVPDEGPVRSAGAGRVCMFPPRMQVLDRNTLPRFVAVIVAVLAAVDPREDAVAGLDALADALDDEAARNNPALESFHNPAKALASRMAGRRVLVLGDSPVTTEIAMHAEEVLLRCGTVAAAGELSEAVASVSDFGPLGGSPDAMAADVDPLFHDEQLDGPRPSDPVRVFAVSTEPDEGLVRRRSAMLGDVDVVRAEVSSPDVLSPPTTTASRSSTARAVEQALVIASRLETAAAYVQLTGGR